MGEFKKICLWCNLEKLEEEFSKNIKHCKKCHYKKYKKQERKKINIICPKCNEERMIREDVYKKRKSDFCNKCSYINNPQTYKSSHNLDIKHPLYKRWSYMKTRCIADDKAKWYKNRGINVCDEWINDYGAFYSWSINNGFNENLELDRINNDLGFYITRTLC